jgi:branched-chain amino acid aminotransferase
VKDPQIQVHICCNALHYGQSLFEGQKVFHRKDGTVCIFNDKENWQRMSNGCQRLMLPPPPQELFHAAIDLCVQRNVEYVPPYGTGCSMYVRPLLFGSSAQIALSPATEVRFLIIVTPVGSYYKAGTLQAIDGMVVTEFDRAAPRGVGNVKAAGNYAADMKASCVGKKTGYPIGLYLDPVNQKYVEEFNTSNFVAIVGNTYVTPQSSSILPSITNKCLEVYAKDLGLKVERRPIDFKAEVKSFDEVGAVGTAVVVTPIASLTYGSDKWTFKTPNVLQKLHEKVRRVQDGEEEDTHSFLRRIPDIPAFTGDPKTAASPIKLQVLGLGAAVLALTLFVSRRR